MSGLSHLTLWRSDWIRRSLFGGLVGGLLAGSTLVAPVLAADSEQTVRPELGKPLQAAQELIRQKKFGDALNRLHDADSVHDLTAYETLIIAQLRGAAASGTGDYVQAAHAYEGALASAATSSADKAKLTLAIAGFYYQAKDFPAAVHWARRALGAGSPADQTRLLLGQSLYLSGDYASAAAELESLAQAQTAAGQTPAESTLQVILDSRQHLNDGPATLQALEALVRAWPKTEYWQALILKVSRQPGFPDRLALDISRLKQAVGVETAASDLIDHVELALATGLPGEADKIFSAGVSAGILAKGTGAEADRQRRLQATLARQVSSDKATLAAAETEATAKTDGNALISTGLDWSGYGGHDKALSLIRQGIGKGGLKHPEEAALHLGYAAWAAGKTDSAGDAFRELSKTTGPASDLARLWLIVLKQKAA